MNKLTSLIVAAVAAVCAVADPLESDWEKFEEAFQDEQYRTATNILTRIEKTAEEKKLWPDLAAAFLFRARTEYAITEENALDAEKARGLVETYAAKVEATRPEIRPMLRLALAHDYFSMYESHRFWRGDRTQLADATNQPPWAAERIAKTLGSLVDAVAADRETLMAEKVPVWHKLLSGGDDFADLYRPTLWDFALNDIVDLAGRTSAFEFGDASGQPGGNLTKGKILAWLDELAAVHEKAGRTDAQAYALFRKAQLTDGDMEAFAEEWFDKSSVSALAAESVANRLSFGSGEERLKAHAIAEKYYKRWSKTPGGISCLNVIKRLEQPSFFLQTENQLLAKGEKIVVSSCNISNLHFRAVKIDPKKLPEWELIVNFRENLFRRGGAMDKLYNSKPEAEWSAPINNGHDYVECRSECEIPSGMSNGYYAIFASASEDFNGGGGPVEVAIVSRTDLYLAKSKDGETTCGFVFDAESGKPQAGVEVEYWVRGRNGYELKATGKSAEDGSWTISVKNDEWRNGIVRAVRDGTGTMFVDTHDYWHRGETCLNHIDIVTDRAIYRPGQKVLFKGYLYYVDREKRDFHVVPGQRVRVAFSDPNNKKVETIELTSNDFGSFSGEFTAPRDRIAGEYRIRATSRLSSATDGITTVGVEEYKRPKFTATIDKADGLLLGRETTLTGRALTYSGLPVANAKVKWEIRRNVFYPYWCWWRNGGYDAAPVASGETVTDDNGEFKCVFTPEAPNDVKIEDEPSFDFSVSANVTDETGEMHPAAYSFTIGVVPWRASLSEDNGDAEWKRTEVGTKFKTQLTTFDDKPVADVEGEVKAYSLAAPERVARKPLSVRNWRYGYFRNGDRYQAHDPSTWSNADVVAACKVKNDEKGMAEGVLKLPAGAYRLEYTAKTPDGKTVRDERFVRVIDPAADSYAVREPFFLDFEKTTVRVGDTARLFFGTGYESAHWRVRVTQGSKTLLDEARTGSIGVVEFPVKEEHRGLLSFEIVFEKENRLYVEGHTVDVPWNEHLLKVTSECITSKLLPDATETWRFRVSGENTNDVRRSVEVLALMFDKSLDAFRGHHPYIDFSRSFGLPRELTFWNYPNGDETFSHWRGEWGDIPLPDHIRWRNWDSDVIGVLDVVNDGWMAGNRFRFAGAMSRTARMRNEAFDDEVLCDMVAECAEPEPMALCAPEAKKAKSAAPLGHAIGGKGVDEPAPERKPEEKVVPRKNLQETAFFMPSLVADENGVVEFSFTVPQAITGWKFFLLAHGKNLSSGCFDKDDIVTVKPLMVEPNGPRFAREGDDFLFPVKVTNTSDKPEKGHVALEFFDAESGRPALENGRFEFDLAAGESKTFEFRTRIPDGCGYLRYVAKAAGAEFTDGEEGFLPVLSKRVMVQESMPLQIRKKGERKFHFERLEKSGESDTLRHVGLAAQVVSDPTWYAFLALPYLMEYPHECNEQIFSRYYANALAAKIANSDPAYKEVFLAWEKDGANALRSPLELNDDLKSIILDATPWVNDAADETRARRHIGELFGSARLEAEQARALDRLKNGIADDDLWSWFPGGPGSEWVTMHILTGFGRLESLGIDPMAHDGDLRLKAERARKALDKKMEEDIDKRLALPVPFTLQSHDLRWLYLQSFSGKWNKRHEKLLFRHLADEWTKFSIAGESMAAIAAWRHGDKDLAAKIVRGLKERAVRSEEFGLYWKRHPFFDCSLFAAPVSDQALAMEAFLLVDPDDVAAYDDARLWLLEQKRTQNWSSTVSTVDAVYAILLGRGKGAPVKVGPVAMKLGETEVSREKAEVGTGFYEGRFGVGEIKPEMGEITLSRKEDALGWASVTWTYLEDATKVAAYEEKDLRVTKTYYKKTRVDGKIRLVGLGGGEKLMPGDELVSRITIDSNRIYEYVHLKDERPASAEPVDVISRYRWQDGLGYYQSTRDTATHYYFDRLPKGNFVLETSFRVRQKGVFSSGLATLECMYAPEFGAHSNASIIEVVQP